jgi:hypothetical protein
MQCPACAAENPADYRFCDTCGAALVRCGQCGAMGRPGAHFCGKCGSAFDDADAPRIPAVQSTPAAVRRRQSQEAHHPALRRPNFWDATASWRC